MLHFTVDDAYAVPVDGCVKCCCEPLSLKPGTVSKMSVGYASWAVPIGRLHCPPQFVLEEMKTCEVSAGTDLPPRPASKVAFDVPSGLLFNGDLRSQVTDPENLVMTFKLIPLYGPHFGKLALKPDGTFQYTSDRSYTGADSFYASVSDGVNPPVVFEVILGVDLSTTLIPSTPHVSVDRNAAVLDPRLFAISFPVKVTPAAQTCEIWRLTVLQSAIDCECQCYNRTDCFDIRIVKC